MTPPERVIDGVHVVTAKGRRYVYAWRGGPRLMAPVGSAEFVAELAAAHASRRAMPGPSTIAGLILDFRASRAFRSLAPASRKDYERLFPSILAEFGAAPPAAFDDPRIRKDIRRWHDAFARDRQADKALAALSRLMSFARADGLINADPTAGVGKRYRRILAPSPWTEEELALYVGGREASAGAPAIPPAPLHLARIALLASMTGLARVDLARVGRAHLDGTKIEIRRQKSKQRAQIFIGPDLRALIEATPRDRLTLLADEKGGAWKTADALGKAFDRRRRECGIGKTLHDLRATFATRLYRVGAVDTDVADTLGWSEKTCRHIRLHYVDEAAIFDGRVARLSGAQSGAGGAPRDEAGTQLVKRGVKPASDRA